MGKHSVECSLQVYVGAMKSLFRSSIDAAVFGHFCGQVPTDGKQYSDTRLFMNFYMCAVPDNTVSGFFWPSVAAL